jgi:hypothetical protein
MVEPSPLLVMLTVMRRKWRDGDEEGAVALAKAAAPYVHPRAPAARTSPDLSQVSDDELDELDGRGGAGAADGGAA